MAYLMHLACSATANRGKRRKNAYKKYSEHIAEVLAFITEVEEQIDG